MHDRSVVAPRLKLWVSLLRRHAAAGTIFLPSR
jgi:hypothetical protein